MKAVIQGKTKRLELQKERNNTFNAIDQQEQLLGVYVKAESKINAARVHYAASKVCALVRGFLDRIVVRNRRKYFRAIGLIQRVIKGKLGRIRWKREYWRSISVVKSDASLKDMLDRSKLIREKVKMGRFAYHWQEFFDTLTVSFWYYNRITKQNTWEVPFCFQDSLVCTWNGYASFGALTSSKPCRAVFKHVAEYHNHLRTAHKWNCVACFQSNTGIDFPTCSLCGNKFSEDGLDGEQEMKKAAKEVHDQIVGFLQKDTSANNVGIYRIRDRMIDIALEQRQAMEKLMLQRALDSAGLDDDRSVGSKSRGGKRKGKSLTHTHAVEKQSLLVNVLTENYFGGDDQQRLMKVGGTSEHKESLKLPTVPGAVPRSSSSSSAVPSSSASAVKRKSGGNTAGRAVLGLNEYATHGVKPITAPMDTGFQTSHAYRLTSAATDGLGNVQDRGSSTITNGQEGKDDSQWYPAKTVKQLFAEKAWKESGGLEGEAVRFRDPLITGKLTVDDFDLATLAHEPNKLQRKRLQKILLQQQQAEGATSIGPNNDEMVNFAMQNDLDDSDEDDEDEDVDNRSRRSAVSSVKGGNSVVSRNKPPDDGRDKDQESSVGGDGGVLSKLLVCPQFIEGTCSLTTCPYAHPGIRDSAKIYYKVKRRQPKDAISGSMPGAGSDGRIKIPFVFVCDDHVSSLPPLDEDNDDNHSLHSVQTGDTRAAALHTGCPRGIQCVNYHVYVRPSTQAIIQRIYPKTNGIKSKTFHHNRAQLTGQVKRGVFEGYGRMQWSSGAVYLGDWIGERREGFGIYRNAHGDEYAGEFVGGVRHGWGVYSAANGEEYIGQWVDGKLHGVGMLKHVNGDVYQGQFQRGRYHGIGYFQRSTGDCYLGYHVDNCAQGLGIESRFHKTRTGRSEKYKGYFDRNARHGRGACCYTYHDPQSPARTAVYLGGWYRGVHEGSGLFQCDNGDRYVGQWSGGCKHGVGRYHFGATQDFYDGEFHKDAAQGQGLYYHANGNIYKGQWYQDMRHGRGTYQFATGSVYTGNWFENRIHLKGKFDFANGAHYRGHFNFNQKHGKGIYTWASGTIYTGEFFDEKLCGFGEMQYVNGHRYVGEWRANKKQGQGTFYYRYDTAIYTGEFFEDLRQGQGRLVLMPGTQVQESYEGSWWQDQWHGFGRYTYTYRAVKALDDQLEAVRLRQERSAREEELQIQREEEAKRRQKKRHGSMAAALAAAAAASADDHDDPAGKSTKVDVKKANAALVQQQQEEDAGSVGSGHGTQKKSKKQSDHKKAKKKSVSVDPNVDVQAPGDPNHKKHANKGINGGKQGGHGKPSLQIDTSHNSTSVTASGVLLAAQTVQQQFATLHDLDNGNREDAVEAWYYEGDWENNLRHGHGTLVFTDHSYYRGEFQRDQLWGKGVYVHVLDQTQYEGMWRANMRHGLGTSLEPDGSIFTGEFFSNMKQGEGQLLRPDGLKYMGMWDANTIVGNGRVQIPVGDPRKHDGLKKTLTCKVFGY